MTDLDTQGHKPHENHSSTRKLKLPWTMRVGGWYTQKEKNFWRSLALLRLHLPENKRTKSTRTQGGGGRHSPGVHGRHRRFIYKKDTSTHAQGTDPRVASGVEWELPWTYLGAWWGSRRRDPMAVLRAGPPPAEQNAERIE